MDILSELFHIEILNEHVLDTPELNLVKQFRIVLDTPEDIVSYKGNGIYSVWTLEGKRYYFTFQNNRVVSVTNYEETETDDPRKELSASEKAFFELNKDKFRFRHRSVKSRYWITKHENGCPKKYSLIDIDEHQYSKEYDYLHAVGLDYYIVGEFTDNGLKTGIVDSDGKELVPCKYNIGIYRFPDREHDHIIFRYDKYAGVMNFKGEILLKPEFDNIEEIWAEFIVARKRGVGDFLYSHNGTLLLKDSVWSISAIDNRIINYKDEYAEVYIGTYKTDYDPIRIKYEDLPPEENPYFMPMIIEDSSKLIVVMGPDSRKEIELKDQVKN